MNDSFIPMTIKRLEQFSALSAEITLLEEQLVKYEGMSGASGSGRLRAILSERRARLRAELEAIETFIDAIPDSDIRQIIQLRFINGLSWSAAAYRVFGYPSETRARKKIARFFEKYQF